MRKINLEQVVKAICETHQAMEDINNGYNDKALETLEMAMKQYHACSNDNEEGKTLVQCKLLYSKKDDDNSTTTLC